MTLLANNDSFCYRGINAPDDSALSMSRCHPEYLNLPGLIDDRISLAP